MFPGPLKILDAGPDWERGVLLLAVPSKVVLGKNIANNYKRKLVVPEQNHFDTDPFPRIRTTGLRIRILLPSSVASRSQQKINFFQSFL